MRKKLITLALAAAVAVAAFALCACSGGEKEKRTQYTIEATLSEDNTLTASVVCDYVNCSDVPLGEVDFHLYAKAYGKGVKYCPIPADRIVEAFPDGRSYSELEITSVTVAGKPVEAEFAGEDGDILCVPLSKKLEPSDSIRIKTEYTLKLPKVRHRLGYTDKSVNLAHFYPIACIYENGAFDRTPYYSTGDPFYSECADYNVTLTAPAKYTGGFTGRVKSEADSEDGSVKTYEIRAEKVRDFAAVLGEYTKLSGRCGQVVVNYLYYSDADAEGALNAAVDAVRIFGEMFGTYPYPEYTVVQTGFLHGGMEYPCLSMISDSCTGDVKRDVIVHETAHQWWYGLVGNNEVKNAWLDEGLAEYSTMMFYERAEGYSYTFDAKRADALTAYMLYCEAFKNNGLGDTSMTRSINEYADETEYSYMNYVKGALMLDDIRNTVGSTKFIAGLKQYCKQNSYRNAQPADLIGAMEKASKRSLDALFRSWLDGNVKLFASSK